MYLSSIHSTVSPMISVYNKNSRVAPITSMDEQQQNARLTPNLIFLVNAFSLCAMPCKQELKLLLRMPAPHLPPVLPHPVQIGWAGYLNECWKKNHLYLAQIKSQIRDTVVVMLDALSRQCVCLFLFKHMQALLFSKAKTRRGIQAIDDSKRQSIAKLDNVSCSSACLLPSPSPEPTTSRGRCWCCCWRGGSRHRRSTLINRSRCLSSWRREAPEHAHNRRTLGLR